MICAVRPILIKKLWYGGPKAAEIFCSRGIIFTYPLLLKKYIVLIKSFYKQYILYYMHLTNITTLTIGSNTTVPVNGCWKDNRSLLQRVWHSVRAFFYLIDHYLHKIPCFFFKHPSGTHSTSLSPTVIRGNYPLNQLPWNISQKSDGLFFLVHGVFGSPAKWEKYIEDLKTTYPSWNLIAPVVPFDGGHCEIKRAADPLSTIFKNFRHNHPQSPICFVSFSNGGRLVSQILAELKDEEASLISNFSIAVPYNGSIVLDSVRRIRGLARLLGWNQKFMTRSEISGPPTNVRTFVYAGTNDECVSLKSAVPAALSQHTKITIVSGAPHIGMPEASREALLDDLRKLHIPSLATRPPPRAL